ncbi:hypothetical protein MMC15_007935 [Xylographa vitiligo]|nr:hypothetical protein [Xylographa vitiligo]
MADDLMEQFVSAPVDVYGQAAHVYSLSSSTAVPRLTVLIQFWKYVSFTRISVGAAWAGFWLNWGVAKADGMGVESYIDATAEGKSLYEAYGFGAAKALDFSWDTYDASPTRERLEDQLLPFSRWPMWRPVWGESATTESKKPWE